MVKFTIGACRVAGGAVEGVICGKRRPPLMRGGRRPSVFRALRLTVPSSPPSPPTDEIRQLMDKQWNIRVSREERVRA